MKILQIQVPTNFNLFLFGDTHLGTILFNRNAFDEFLDTATSTFDGIPARHNYLVDHGDSIEALTVDDRRYDPKLVEDPRGAPFQQAQDYIDLMEPVRKQIICKLKGNHELALQKFGDLTEWMCRQLCVPCGTYTARITFNDHKGDLIFKSFHTHGRKSITSTADDPKRRLTNQELILKRHMKFKAGDCLLMSKAHTHKLLVCRPNTELYLVDDGRQVRQAYTHSHRAAGYIHPDHRWYVNTGSFYNLYAGEIMNERGESVAVSGYAECFEYDPLEVGYVVVMVRDRQIQDVKRIVLGD